VNTNGRVVGTRKGGIRVYMVDMFASTYENRRMKPVEIVLRNGEEGRGKVMEGVNPY
jgi:hypothetical protein